MPASLTPKMQQQNGKLDRSLKDWKGIYSKLLHRFYCNFHLQNTEAQSCSGIWMLVLKRQGLPLSVLYTSSCNTKLEEPRGIL